MKFFRHAALSLQRVNKSFGGLRAVRDVSIDITHGERRAIIGPNGAGKTTLFNIIAGDLRCSSGKVVIFGTNVTNYPVHRRVRLGLRRTYQTPSLFDSLTVRENLYLALLGNDPWCNHLSPFRQVNSDSKLMDVVENIAENIRLTDKLATPAAELSHGERRQLELGQVLVAKPKLLLLDEPGAGLSSAERGTLMDLLSSLDRSVTVVLIEHDMAIALGIADIVTVLHEGEVVAHGTPDEIRNSELVHRLYLGGTVNV